MALSKKYVVQKSFRIDSKLENDLEQLSEKLGRPQNDLVNYALELLMVDNKSWFAENILVDSLYPIFEGSCEDFEVEIDNVYIRIFVNEYFKTICRVRIKLDNGELDECDHEYEDDPDEFDSIKDFLRQIAIIHLVNKSEIIEPYLKTRLNYR